jgi:biotin synthase
MARRSSIETQRPENIPEDGPCLRHDWTLGEIMGLFELPFNDLLHRAHGTHRRSFDPNALQVSTLLSIKTGACPEDCAYCPQSARYKTLVEPQPLLPLEDVLAAARRAKERGATRFCMGAAWRSPKERDLRPVLAMVAAVKALGLETCVTLGMLTAVQAKRLRDAGLDYYNHNLDSSREFYPRIIRTRTYDDRLETLGHVRAAGIRVCAGGIVGMGESREDRAAMLLTLANLPEHPESVPVNLLVRVPGTPLADMPPPDPFEFVRTIAVARILMPRSFVRLSAGREQTSDELQALCLFAGANSVFYGDKLLTTPNPETDRDRALFGRLGIRLLSSDSQAAEAACERTETAAAGR